MYCIMFQNCTLVHPTHSVILIYQPWYTWQQHHIVPIVTQVWLYRYYGDTRILTDSYNATSKWVSFIEAAAASSPGLIEGGLSDWMSLEHNMSPLTGTNTSSCIRSSITGCRWSTQHTTRWITMVCYIVLVKPPVSLSLTCSHLSLNPPVTP